MYVVPLPSDRCTTRMSRAGSLAPALSDAMRLSFHFVILPRKMSAITSPLRFSGCVRSGTLYVITTAPSTVGKCRIGPPFALLISASVIGASDAPKSTVPTDSC